MFCKSVALFCAYFLYCSLALAQVALGQENAVNFAEYLSGLKRVALEANVSPMTVAQHFPKIKPFKRAVKSSHSVDYTNLEQYIPASVPDILVSTGRVFYQANERGFDQIAAKYGVQPRFLIALWGLSSDFGERQGHYPALSVLASSAFEANQTGQVNHYGELFYVDEFIAALKILERYPYRFEQLTSSQQGTMGHMQIRPSQFLAYAKDGSGDGYIDIWHDINDAMATTANMLQGIGWQADSTWGRQIKATQGINEHDISLAMQKPFTEWQQLGIRRFDGGDLPKRDDMRASLLAPDGTNGRLYLVYFNYRALKRVNQDDRYLLAATYLSERIK
ncbi:lytic transglycosylase domain-containing protein [Shewanella sp. SR44-3]|uniref:lytic murein transglycosylase n=1 Tax=unclassified Shewanella TaxID=196818 RepID=UPI0015F9A235|nr:lytic murein transglycosylase [Shewanella sp. SR44-3]MBB1270408.1 lytic murein transglycosylase [Shewanella sp. SR44-3]